MRAIRAAWFACSALRWLVGQRGAVSFPGQAASLQACQAASRFEPISSTVCYVVASVSSRSKKGHPCPTKRRHPCRRSASCTRNRSGFVPYGRNSCGICSSRILARPVSPLHIKSWRIGAPWMGPWWRPTFSRPVLASKRRGVFFVCVFRVGVSSRRGVL